MKKTKKYNQNKIKKGLDFFVLVIITAGVTLIGLEIKKQQQVFNSEVAEMEISVEVSGMGIDKIENAEDIATTNPERYANNEKALKLVKNYFNAYNGGNYEHACSLISDRKCDSSNNPDVIRFAQEADKLLNGYQEIHLWIPKGAHDMPDNIICVEYAYRYKSDINLKKVTEIVSFYVGDENNKSKIKHRVCEKKTFNEKEVVPCPILSKVDFCK